MTVYEELPARQGQHEEKPPVALEGWWSRLEPLSPSRHGSELFSCLKEDHSGRLWTYMTYGPFATEDEWLAGLERLIRLPGRRFFAVLDRHSGQACGFMALFSRDRARMEMELGHVVFSPCLQRTRIATDAVFLLLSQAFETLRCQRLVWRADRWNHKGKSAALRFGFRPEGLARQDSLYKGRNRDTWWYAILREEWPALKQIYERWLAPDNFDNSGQQRSSFSRRTAELVCGQTSFGAAAQSQVALPSAVMALYPQGEGSSHESAMSAPRVNELGQPIGEALPDWSPRPRPPKTPMQGRLCRVEPLDPARHGDDLFAAKQLDKSGRNSTYLFTEPVVDRIAYREWLDQVTAKDDPFFHAIVDPSSGKAVGVATYMRLQPEIGVIEVGNIHFSPLLQRSALATEAMYLMMRRVFDELGYRRYEWKCDALNAPSRRAAERLGFIYEGTFRQALVYKGRNRDTAWYSIIDKEWPTVKAALEAWLEPTNFDSDGRQKRRLADFRSDLTSCAQPTEA